MEEETVIQKSENIIRNDKFDNMAFNDMQSSSETLKESITKNQERLSTVKRLAEDLFYSLYKHVPQKFEDEKIADSHIHNKNFVDKATASQEYDRLRTYTKLQELESAMATTSILDKLMTEMPKEELDKINQQAQQAQQLEQDIQSMINQIKGLQEAKNASGNPTQQKQLQAQINALQNNKGNAQGQLQKVAGQMKQTSDNLSQSVRRAMRGAMKQAEEEVKEFNDFASGWGMGEGSVQKLPIEQKVMLAQKLKNGKLKELAKIIGRMKRLAMAKQQQKIKKEPNEVVDVTRGNDLGNVLPSELLNLADPETEMLFYKKYRDGELLQYELEGKEKLSRGPIICCVDNSGSMSGINEIISKAFCIGLLEIATKYKRRFACIHFGDSSDPLDVTIIEPTDKPVERMQKLIHMAEYFLGGGTDFEKPLDEAIKVIEMQPVFKKADIIMLTDGECDVDDAWLKRFKDYKKQKEVKVFSILIDGPRDTLDKFSNNVIDARDIAIDHENVSGQVYELIE